MKQTGLSRCFPFLILLAGIIPMSVVNGCKESASLTESSKEIIEIMDSVRNGNMSAAQHLTEELKTKSLAQNDSLLWADAMVQQGIVFYYSGKAGKVLSSSDSAVAWLSRQPLHPRLASVLGHAYQTVSAFYDQYSYNADSSEYYQRKSIRMYEIANSKAVLPQAYGNFANTLRFSGALDSAAVYYHKAITLADSLFLPSENYIALYNGIALVFTDLKDFETSSFWWGKSEAMLPAMGPYDRFNTLSGRGTDYYYKGDYSKADSVFTMLRSWLDSVPHTEWERKFTEVNLADVWLKEGKREGVGSLLDSLYDYFSYNQPNPSAVASLQTLYIRLAMLENDNARAKALLQKWPPADSVRVEQRLLRYEMAEQFHRLAGDPTQAYESHMAYHALADSLRSQQTRQRVSALNAIYARDNRILNLQADNNAKQVRIFRQLAIIALILAVILGLLVWIFYSRHRHRKREDRMMMKIVGLRRENLRGRITPHFIYNALNHSLNRYSTGEPARLDSLVRLIRHQQFMVSEILVTLQTELDFVEDYVSIMSENVVGDFKYKVEISEKLDASKLSFPSMVLQILVENAFKHGFPTLHADEPKILSIHIRETEDGYRVEVFNNSGSGEDCSESTGTGLRVVAETLRMLKESGKGTVAFTLDCNASEDGVNGCRGVLEVRLLQMEN